MSSSEEPGKFSSFLGKVIILIGLGGLVFIGFSISREMKKKEEIQGAIGQLQQEIEKIRRDNSALQEKISYLESSDYQEREAKDKLNLQDPKENVVVIKPSPSKKLVDEVLESAQAPVPPVPEGSNYKKWWDYLFK